MRKTILKFTIILTALSCCPPTYSKYATRKLISIWNEKLRESNDETGHFYEDKGNIVFSGDSSPRWAIDLAIDSMHIDKRYGTGGIDPFKYYTNAKWESTSLFRYLKSKKIVYGWNGKDEGRAIIGTSLIRNSKNELEAFKAYNDGLLFLNNNFGAEVYQPDRSKKILSMVGIACAIIFIVSALHFLFEEEGGRGQDKIKEENS